MALAVVPLGVVGVMTADMTGPVAGIIVLSQAKGLDLRAHRAIQDQDAFGCGLVQGREGGGWGQGHGIRPFGFSP